MERSKRPAGGGTPSATRSTSAASPTATATASATCPGITSRLPYLRDLGVDALWITPFYTSPQHDHGYDVADYCDVDPLFGSLADADDLIARAHELGLRVIVDLVPNHTSDRAPVVPGGAGRRPGQPGARALPVPRRPTRTTPDAARTTGTRSSAARRGPGSPDGQWYLHLFDSTQPDLDWRNPEVGDMFEDVLRFWLDRGVDGFRIDVAHGLSRRRACATRSSPEGRPPAPATARMVERRHGDDEPMWDQPEVHEVYRRWHKILAEYDGDRMAVAEAWTQTPESMARYVRPDELHQAFNFAWLLADWSATAFAEVITGTLAARRRRSARSPTWVLSNHDVIRHATRYGGGERGLARARAATLTMLALPGSAYLYQGEELGLEQVDVAPEHRQDPSWFRTGEPGRDGCRVPIPWARRRSRRTASGRASGQPWIPQPDDWATLTVEAQQADPDSTLAFYREALGRAAYVRRRRRATTWRCSRPARTCSRSSAAR